MRTTLPNAVWIMIALALASIAGPVIAEPATIARVEWGFAGNIPSGRWAPVRVWLNSGDTPETGILSIEYQQDSTQKAKIIVPVSVVPGSPTAVDVLVSLPSEADPITVRYTPATGREQTIEFSAMPTGGQQMAPEIFAETRQLVLCVGTDAPLAAISNPTEVRQRPRMGRSVLGDHRSVSGDDLKELRWFQTAGVRMNADSLPEEPHAYDGVAAIIIDAELAGVASPRSRAAVASWVASGGRLVLLADRDGDAWKSWLAADEPLPVSLAAAGEMPPPAGLRDAAQRGEASELSSSGGDAEDDAPSQSQRAFFRHSTLIRKVKAFEAAVRGAVKGRAISILPAATQSGWNGRLALPEGGFFIAEGPVGLGMVTILGTNPSSISADANPLAQRAAWRLALTPVLDRYLMRPMSLQSMGQEALANVMDRIAGVPEVGRGMLYTTVGLLLLLALLLGVADYFILGKLGLRHLSWGVALLWISLFSAGAAFIIPRIRAGSTSVDRAVCIDILQQANSPTSSASVWQTGVSGVFSGGATQLESDDRNGFGLVRGASAERDRMDFYPRGERRRVGLPAVEALQMSLPGGERASLVSGLRQPPWTYRILTDDSQAPCPIRVTVDSVDSAGAAVRLHGVGPGGEVREAALQIENRHYSWKATLGSGPAVVPSDGTILLEMTFVANARLRLEPEIRDQFGRVMSNGLVTVAPQTARGSRFPSGNTSPKPGSSSTPAPVTAIGPEMYSASLAAAGDRQAALRARAAAGQAVFVADILGPGAGAWLLKVKGEDNVTTNTSATVRVVVPMIGGKP